MEKYSSLMFSYTTKNWIWCSIYSYLLLELTRFAKGLSWIIMLGSLFPRAHVVDCSCSATRMAHCAEPSERGDRGTRWSRAGHWHPQFCSPEKKTTNLLLLLILAPPDILTFHCAALLPNVLHTSGLFIHVIEGIVCLILGYPFSWHYCS